MSRTKRLRSAVQCFLSSKGRANTTQILDHINSRFRWGSSMNQLGNILAKDPRFAKVGFISSSSGHGTRCRVCIWELSARSLLVDALAAES